MSEYIAKDAPSLKEIEFGSNVAYIPRNLKMQLLIWPLITLLVICVSSNTFQIIFMYGGVRKMKKILTGATHRLQRLFFVSTLLEHVVCVTLINYPLVIVIAMIAFPIPYGNYVFYIMLTTMSFQTFISVILQCYFITPFRNGVKDLILLRFLKKSREQNNLVVPLRLQTPVLSMVHSSAVFHAEQNAAHILERRIS